MSRKKQKPILALGMALVASALYFGQGLLETWLPLEDGTGSSKQSVT